MTGFASSRFLHSCADKGCYYDTLPSWDWMAAAFPRNIFPTDIDGMLEINGHFLFLEQKQGGGVPLKEGQRKALRKLSRLSNVTVLFFRPTGRVDEWEVLIYDDLPCDGWQRQTTQWLTDWLHTWAHRADMDGAA